MQSPCLQACRIGWIWLIGLLWSVSVLPAQIQCISVDFEGDTPGSLPTISPGQGDRPTSLNGDIASISVDSLSGNPGQSTASGLVSRITVPTAGAFRLLNFSGNLNSGVITQDTVRVGFDFLAASGLPQDGYAFLRCFDESDESFADIGFNFSGNSYSVGILDYDPLTGDYLGWNDPGFPANTFAVDTWHRFELIIDLNQNILRLRVDGADYGVSGGISRATGSGYLGAYFNWGTAYTGRSELDNFSVNISEPTGLNPPPPGFIPLLTPNPQGGTVLRMPCGDFRDRGLDWDIGGSAAQLFYTPLYDGVSGYRVVVSPTLDEADARLFSWKGLPIQPHRTYEVSALVRTNFPRANWEISAGFVGTRTDGSYSPGIRYGGLPAVTQGSDGWQRWTWRINPHWDAAYPNLTMLWSLHEYGPGFDGNVSFEIADVALIELPAAPLQPFAPGEGVSFPGGEGDLDMKVEGVETEGTIIRVRTSGAIFEMDAAQGTLLMQQRIDFQRRLAHLEGLPLQGLSVQSQNEDLVVLVGDSLTMGIQVDGTLVLSPHAPLRTELISRIGGDFNRLEGGDLICEDDFGGFTANLYVPKGTGRPPRLAALTAGLPFVGLDPEDLASTGAAAPGWRAEFALDPGERLFLSVFPSRPYDWAQSFEQQWALTFEGGATDYQNPVYVTDWVLWDVSERGWGMSQGPRYELRDNVTFLPHVLGISQAGDNWGSYFSQWFYYSRDAAEWTNELKRWRDSLNMDVVYSDGLAQDDWLVAYEGMRRLRAIFPNKPLIIHDSYPQSGVAAAAFRPFIYSYATSTYMGENAPASGEDWAWARYAMGQYRRSNAFGVTKGDGWLGFEGVEKYLIGLVWGGRGRPFVSDYESVYLPVLTQLQTLWQTYGDDPHFFDRYYHPEAQLLTGYTIGRTGMPIFMFDTLGNGTVTLGLSSWTPGASLHYTTDGSLPDANSPLFQAPLDLTNVDTLRAIALHPDYEVSAVAEWAGEFITSHAPTLPAGGLLYAAPNPAHEATTIRFQLSQGQPAHWQLLDLQGKTVQERPLTPTEIQSGQFLLRTHDLANGLYVLQWRNEAGRMSHLKIVVRH